MDLTKIDKPFNELDRETKMALLAAWVDGRNIESSYYREWHHARTPFWDGKAIYRIRPEHSTPDSVDWNAIDARFICMARDEDCTVWLYDAEPKREDLYGHWESNGEDAKNITGLLTSYRRGTVDWKDSLVWRPGCEPEGGE